MDIEKDVPIPDRSAIAKILKSLGVLDSVKIEGSQRRYFYKTAMKIGIKIVIHKIDGNGLRLWRVK